MSGPLYRRDRRDANEPAIRRVVEEEFGGQFQPISIKDGPDAIVGHAGLTELWEIKNGAKKLRLGQERWAEGWKGGPVATVRNEAQARRRLRMMAMRVGSSCTGGGGRQQAWEDEEGKAP